MRNTLFGLGLAAAPIASAFTNAAVTEQNPVGTVYKAELPSLNSSSIVGYASATGNTNGTGVVWSINFSNLPATGGPFLYHVHADPVPADGNCTGAGPHLDPTNRTETPPCDLSQGAASCQVGDLAGKHGQITADPWQPFYLDVYTSTTPGSAAFVGNRSLVIHDAALNRIACTNFTMLAFASEPSAASSSTAAVQSGSSPATLSSAASSATTSGTSASSSDGPAAPNNANAATSSAPATASGAAAGMQVHNSVVAGAAAVVALAAIAL